MEAFTACRAVRCAGGLNTTPPRQGGVFEHLPKQRSQAEPTFQGQRRAEEPPIAWGQLEGQLAVAPS